MGWFNNKETPEILEKRFSGYFEMFENTVLGYVFSFHDNDGKVITFKENTGSRNVFLKRDYDQIELIKLDDDNNVIFKKSKWLSLSAYDKEVIDAIHDLYTKEMMP